MWTVKSLWPSWMTWAGSSSLLFCQLCFASMDSEIVQKRESGWIKKWERE